MTKYESKNWIATWETNVSQKKLPSEKTLQTFLDRHTDYAVFQLELGEKRGKLHYQIAFVLRGTRKNKKHILDIFRSNFDNVGGLSLRIAHSREAVFEYCSKKETRVGGTVYAGQMENYDMELSDMKLRPWQQSLYDFILSSKDNEEIRSRKILWIEDSCGNTGKSAFVKYLVAGQRELKAHKLPVSSVDRLNSAVTKIVKQEKVDLFIIDLTRSKGKEQSYGDLFAALEDIKNGHVVDVMYGNYVESIFRPPLVVVFTNLSLTEYEHSLSKDRWIQLVLDKYCSDGKSHVEIKERGYSPNGVSVWTKPLVETMKNYQAELATPPDEDFPQKVLVSGFTRKNPDTSPLTT